MKLTIEQITEIQSQLVWAYKASLTKNDKNYDVGFVDGMKFMLHQLGYEIKTELSQNLSIKIYIKEIDENATI